MLLIFFLLVILLAALFFYFKKSDSQIRRWRKSLSLDKHEQCFQLLYNPINGFLLSKKARKKQDSIEYLYGEIEFESFIALLSLCHPDNQTIFYDLGSGVGKAVIACAMVFPVKKSCGIELFEELVQCSLQQKNQLQLIKDYKECAQRIEFKQGDFLTISLEEANLIFINATAFMGDYWLRISKYLEETKPTTYIITTSKKITSSQFTLIRKVQVKMSWGIVDAFIHQRNFLYRPQVIETI